MASYEAIENNMLEAMAGDEAMKDWTLAERKKLLFKMRVFQMGLSVMIANGHVPSWLDEHDFDALLMETGDDVLLAHQVKRKEGAK